MNVGEKLGAAVPTVSGEDEGWVVERTPNGVWIHGPSPTPGSFAPPRMIFLPDTVFAALVAAAEERGAADRERVARVQQAMAAAQATDHGVGVPQRCVWLGDLNHALDLTGGSS